MFEYKIPDDMAARIPQAVPRPILEILQIAGFRADEDDLLINGGNIYRKFMHWYWTYPSIREKTIDHSDMAYVTSGALVAVYFLSLPRKERFRVQITFCADAQSKLLHLCNSFIHANEQKLDMASFRLQPEPSPKACESVPLVAEEPCKKPRKRGRKTALELDASSQVKKAASMVTAETSKRKTFSAAQLLQLFLYGSMCDGDKHECLSENAETHYTLVQVKKECRRDIDAQYLFQAAEVFACILHGGMTKKNLEDLNCLSHAVQAYCLNILDDYVNIETVMSDLTENALKFLMTLVENRKLLETFFLSNEDSKLQMLRGFSKFTTGMMQVVCGDSDGVMLSSVPYLNKPGDKLNRYLLDGDFTACAVFSGENGDLLENGMRYRKIPEPENDVYDFVSTACSACECRYQSWTAEDHKPVGPDSDDKNEILFAHMSLCGDKIKPDIKQGLTREKLDMLNEEFAKRRWITFQPSDFGLS